MKTTIPQYTAVPGYFVFELLGQQIFNTVKSLYNKHFGTSQFWCILPFIFITYIFITATFTFNKQNSTDSQFITIYKY